ncbi:hypothetical protein [Streptomyces sp. ME18-1-4]|uniref:hypothetical protein n=1 Tax=Streptomyces sp. ME18-1-4 TaxID=3028685 RepID=UPI0029B05132|nr:hypothetical protein [Streptomyces sp. ME18-1-4]MDX3240431.1 hypothetical protein [Streptomyces sp. ME18-1-4]
MPQTTTAVIDQYITLFDRLTHDPAALEEILALFAPDATVQLFEGQEPLVGSSALGELYGGFAQGMVDSKHVWTTTVLDDGRIELRWLHASRRVDDRLVALSGIEYVALDADGLITSLDNRMVAPGQSALIGPRGPGPPVRYQESVQVRQISRPVRPSRGGERHFSYAVYRTRSAVRARSQVAARSDAGTVNRSPYLAAGSSDAADVGVRHRAEHALGHALSRSRSTSRTASVRRPGASRCRHAPRKASGLAGRRFISVISQRRGAVAPLG